MKEQGIYLDFAAATPVDPRVLEAYMKITETFANPSSIHSLGTKAKEILADSRKDVADVCNALAREIIFTTGATESNNLALLGIVRAAKREGVDKPHIVSSSIEHDSIKEVLKQLKREGAEITFLDPNSDGVVEPQVFKEALTDKTVLAAFAHVHSELGSIAPIEDCSKVIRDFRKQAGNKYPYLHVDASQSLTVFPAQEIVRHADTLSADASKFYGVRGAGFLFVRDGVEVEPVLFGGGQERSLRPGTENVAAVSALARALTIANESAKGEHERLQQLSNFFIEELRKAVPEVKISSPEDEGLRAPHIIDVCFPGKDAEFLVITLDSKGIYVSRGSACKESGPDISEAVLKTKGAACAESSLRFSLGRDTTEKNISSCLEVLKEA